MSRKKRVYEDRVQPDLIYSSYEISKFVNHIMKNGKKELVLKAFYSALKRITKSETITKHESLSNADPKQIFEYSIKQCQPSIEVNSRRIGGSNFQIPKDISNTPRSTSLAVKWLAKAVRAGKNANLESKITSALLDAINNKGYAVSEKERIAKIAEANKAYAHFANDKKKK
jgi:small subunit ribosomal protein S7